VKESFETADGRTLAFERRGSGPTLVCHPGGPGFSGLEFDSLAGLDRQFELILLDPRGAGDSQRPGDPAAYTFADYASDVDALRERLGLERLNLLGFSHGGCVAIAYAAAYPGRVRRLILAATLARVHAPPEDVFAALEGEPWYADARAALEAEEAGRYQTDEELADIVFRELPLYFARFGDDERAYLERVREVPNADTLLFFNREIVPTLDLRPELRAVDAPALVLCGARDFICGPAAAEEIAASLTEARLAVFPDCGHFLFVEAADAFAAEIVEFAS
jgi:proline iminopeptidase